MKKILKKNITTIIPPIIQEGTFITDIKEKCEIFNEYFKNQCTVLPTSSTIPPHITKTTTLTLDKVNFTANDITDHIRRLNINKAHGHDDIPVRLLKICDNAISSPLYIIFRNCISKGKFPKKWKKGNIIPIHKKNERNLITNYRPVSLLPICGKIFEKIIFDNLYGYIFNNNFISDKQSGYRNNDSTVKQLLSITHEIYKAFDNSQEICAVFLDISRAFDRVWHEGLIFKLKSIGIEGEMINILGNFLSERMQRVAMNGSTSQWAKVEAGVPQGSILGPILFLVYINDIIESVESDIRIFADDTFIFRIADQQSTKLLNEDLERITIWANKWKMLFNPDMTKQAVEVVFSHKRQPTIFDPLTFNNIPVKQVTETKHLGMILDRKLNFKHHLEKKIAKANMGLGSMQQLKKWVSHNTLEVIYKLYVRPHLDYGDTVFDIAELDKLSIFPSLPSNFISKEVEKIQYKAARIVSGAWKGTSRDKLYENLGWESLQSRRTTRKLCILYEVKNTNFPAYLKNILDNQEFTERSRYFNTATLKPFICKSKSFKLSFFPSTIRDWNNLDTDTKLSISKSSFKKKLNNKIRSKKNPTLASPQMKKSNILPL